MDKVIRINISRIIVTILIALAFTSKIGRTYMPWYYPYVICMPIYVFVGYNYFSNLNYRCNKIIKLIFWMSIVPYLVAIVYSFSIKIYRKDVIDFGMRSFSVSMQEIATIFLAVLMFFRFGRDSIDIIMNSAIISYIFSLILAIKNVGLSGFLNYLNTYLIHETTNNRWFEVHDIGLSIGFFIVYELALAKKKNILKICMLLVVLGLCYKRITIAALFVTVIVWFVTKKRPLFLKDMLMNIVMGIVFLFCITYLMLIADGQLYEIAEKIGLDFSNRKYLFSFVSRLYTWSVSYMGHGLGFTEKYLSVIRNTSLGLRIANMQHVHNDILKTYIDLGFLGSMIWFFWYTNVIPRAIAIHDKGGIVHYIVCLATLYSYICYSTDNTSTYFVFQLSLYSLIMCSCYRDDYAEDEENNNMKANLKEAS